MVTFYTVLFGHRQNHHHSFFNLIHYLSKNINYNMRLLTLNMHFTGAPNRGGGLGGSQPPPPEFWMGRFNTCQPLLILRKKILRGVCSPYIDLTI